MIRRFLLALLLAPTLASAASVYSNAVLADSPCIYYVMDEASGTTMADSSGNGRGGTYNSAGVTYHQTGPNQTDANLLYAIGLNGTSGYAAVSTLETACSRPSKSNGVGWTVELSAYMTDSTNRGDMVGVDGAVGHSMYLFEKSQGSDAAFYFVLYDNAGNGSNSGAMGSFSTATWYHLIVTTVGDGTNVNPLKFYINGALTSTITSYNKFNALTDQTFIGKDGSNSSLFFGGRLADISFYEAALTSTQVTTHYNAWASTPKAGLNNYSVKRTSPPRPWSPSEWFVEARR